MIDVFMFVKKSLQATVLAVLLASSLTACGGTPRAWFRSAVFKLRDLARTPTGCPP